MHIKVDLNSLQPSQLYINAEKLSSVLKSFSKQRLRVEKFPVIMIQKKYVFTDQHTRALAAHLFGINEIEVYMDTDDISHEMYIECVNWCHDEKIYAIADLIGRVVDDTLYQKLWIERCRIMHRDVLSKQSHQN